MVDNSHVKDWYYGEEIANNVPYALRTLVSIYLGHALIAILCVFSGRDAHPPNVLKVDESQQDNLNKNDDDNPNPDLREIPDHNEFDHKISEQTVPDENKANKVAKINSDDEITIGMRSTKANSHENQQEVQTNLIEDN